MENSMPKTMGVLGMAILLTAFLNAQESDQVRSPEVAGAFYPGDAGKLTEMIDEFLMETKPVIEGDIGGLVSPHAGYVYSGPVAAWSYRQIMGKKYNIVVVIAPSHFEYFKGSSIYPGTSYETPLGTIPIDREISQKIVDAGSTVHFSKAGHEPKMMGRGEHALEVQLPFLQKVLGNFKLVPIVIADQKWENIQDLGNALASVLKDQKVLIVASSDLSHYHSYKNAYELDKNMLDLFNVFDYRKIIDQCESRSIEACGYGPIAAMMYTCRKLGFKKSKVIKYATSGDVPMGEKSQVVGYMSGVVYH
jgi:AmmeMemoRadiSam system protein B